MTTPLETTNTIVQPTVTNPPVSQYNMPVPQAPTQYFTAEDIERARQQEKDKLYERLQKQETQLTEFKSAVDELKADKRSRDDEATAARAAAEEAARLAQQAELTAQQKLEAKQAEFEKQQVKLREDMEFKLTLMQKEQELLQLKSYIQRRVNEEVSAGNIIPDLVKYINGETEAEVEASINTAKEDTANIVNGAQRMVGAPVPGGVSPTGGPSGPLDNLSGPRQPSLEELKGMSQAEFRKYRTQIGLDRAGNGQGLFS